MFLYSYLFKSVWFSGLHDYIHTAGLNSKLWFFLLLIEFCFDFSQFCYSNLKSNSFQSEQSSMEIENLSFTTYTGLLGKKISDL